MKTLGRSMSRPPLTPVTTKPDTKTVLEALRTSHLPADTTIHHQITYIPYHQLVRNPNQPRRAFDVDALEDLAESIRSANGILEPLLVRKLAANRYEIIAGERRWRAAAIIDLDELPCIIRNDLDEQQILVFSLIENLQRHDLNPIEEARALRRLVDEFELSHQEASNAVGRSRSAVSNLLRLLDADPSVQQAVESGTIESGHARALLALETHEQRALLARTVQHQWSVRQIEAAVRNQQHPSPGPASRTTDVEMLNNAKVLFGKQLGYRPTINVSKTGEVTIRLRNTTDLGKLLTSLEPEINK